MFVKHQDKVKTTRIGDMVRLPNKGKFVQKFSRQDNSPPYPRVATCFRFPDREDIVAIPLIIGGIEPPQSNYPPVWWRTTKAPGLGPSISVRVFPTVTPRMIVCQDQIHGLQSKSGVCSARSLRREIRSRNCGLNVLSVSWRIGAIADYPPVFAVATEERSLFTDKLCLRYRIDRSPACLE